MAGSDSFSNNGLSTSFWDDASVKSLLGTTALESTGSALKLSQSLNVKSTAMASFESQLQSLTQEKALTQSSDENSGLTSKAIRLGNTSMRVFPTNYQGRQSFADPVSIDPVTGKPTTPGNGNTQSRPNGILFPDTSFPDLVTHFEAVSLPTSGEEKREAQGQISITNQGNRRARGRINTILYASADPFLDIKDTQLTVLEPQLINLSEGQSQTYSISFKWVQELADKGYYLIAESDAQNTIQELGKGNNLAVFNPAALPEAQATTQLSSSEPVSRTATTNAVTTSSVSQGANTTLRRTVFWNHPNTGENLLWYTDDSTWFSSNNNSSVVGIYETLPTQTDLSWKFQTTGDFDGDGQTDILWRNTQGAIQAWLMKGTTRTQIVDIGPSITDINWQIQGASDFDGDGRDDIVWRNYSTGTPASGQNVIWSLQPNASTGKYDIKPNTGIAYFQNVNDPNWKIQGVGDFNNDQKSDLIWRNGATGENAIWLLNGVNFLSSGYFPTVSDQNWQIHGASDFNGDGKSDLLWQNATTGENATWYMDGTNILGGNPSNSASYAYFTRSEANQLWRNYTPYRFYETNPTVTVGLTNDTAIDGTNTDRITNNPTVSGQVTGARASRVLKARLGTTQAFGGIITDLPTDGRFVLTPSQLQQLNGGTSLADGTYTLQLQAQDIHKNLSSITSLTFTLDTQSPTIGSSLTLASSSDTGRSNADRITNQRTLTFTGTADVGSTVQLFSDGQKVGQATTTSSGAWQVTSSALTDGSHSLIAKAFDTAGNVAITATPLTVTIDTQVAAPSALKLIPESDTGSSSTDNITNQTEPIITGVTEAQAQVTIQEGTTVLGTTIADNTGAWQITPTSVLTTGTHSLTATATDVAGNNSVASTLSVQVDTVVPTLALSTDYANATLDSMSRLAGTLSEQHSGIASLKYHFGTGADTPVSVGSDGKFDQAFNLNGLPVGSTTLTITATDVAGNIVSTAYNVTIPADIQSPTIDVSFDSSSPDQPKVVAQVTDDRGVQSLQAGFNQTQFSNISVDTATGNYIIDLKQLNGGNALNAGTAYTVHLKAQDTSNNVSLESIQVYFVASNQPINIPISNPNGTTPSGQLQLPAPNATNGPKDPTTNQPYTGPIFIQQTPEGEIKIDMGKAVCPEFKYIPPTPPPIPPSPNRPSDRYDYKLYYIGSSPVAVGAGNFENNQLIIQGNGSNLQTGTYLLAPDYVPVKPLSEIDANPDENCVACRSRKQLNGDASVELHSGAVLKSHDLVSYQSKDQTQTWGLSYNSLRADVRPIVHFGHDNIGANTKDNYRMTGLLKVKTNGGDVISDGYTSDLNVPGAQVGENYWKLPSQSGGIQGALQVDMRGQTSGVYDYELETGIKVLCGCMVLAGETTTLRDKLVVVNGADSDFGTGWGLAGLQKIYETTTHNGGLEYNALLVDGDGSYIVFSSTNGRNYAAANGDFSILTKQPDGKFSRITKDGTIYAFNEDNKLISTTDLNGQTSQIVYDSETKRLLKIVDSANLETTFTHDPTTGRIASITDPAGRTTGLAYESYTLDLNGQSQTQYRLKSITDPDTYTRSFGYTANANSALLTSDQDKQAKSSFITYDDLTGRAKEATDKNQAVTTVSPAQTKGVRPVNETKNPISTTLPTASTPELGRNPFNGEIDEVASADYKDGVQNAPQHTGSSKIYLNRSQEESYTKDEFGTSNLIERNNSSNGGRYLPSKVTDARGQQVSYSYDANGNITRVSDPLANNTPAPGAFFPDADISSSRYSWDGIAVDWDGDHKADLISNNYSDTTVAYGDGKGLFSAPVKLTGSGDHSNSIIAIGDLNHDGHPDLVTVAERYSETPKIRVYVSNPTDHTLQTPQEFLVPHGNSVSEVTHLVLADLNGDDCPEIVAMGLGYDSEKWQMALKNNGAGGFQDSANGALQNPLGLPGNDDGNHIEYSKIAVGDINGDSRQDVVLVASNPQPDDERDYGKDTKIYTLLGQANGEFTVGSSLETVSSDNGTTIALGHFSSAATNDLLIGDDNTLIIFVGNGQGGFAAPTTQTIDGTFFKDSLRDINGDSVIDLVIQGRDFTKGNQFLIRYGTGNGSFGLPQTYSTDSYAVAPLAWGDLDGNQQIDLLLSTPSAISSLQQQADHSFVVQSNASAPEVSSTSLSFGSTPIQTIVSDVSGDWVPDLIALTSTGLSVRMGYGDGTYADPMTVALSSVNQAIAAGDLNADGSKDVVVADASGNLTVVMGDGKGKFLTPQSSLVPVGSNPTALALQDLNGDGSLDLVSTNATSNTVSILFGTGTDGFTASGTYTVGTSPKALTIGDMNGDSKLDIVIANAGSNSVSVLTNNSSGAFTLATTYGLDSSPTAIALGDINGDGFRDLVVGTNSTTDNLLVFQGQASTLPQTIAQKYTFGDQPVATVALADLDGDGKTDVVTASTSTYESKIYVQLGGMPTFSTRQRYQFNGSQNTGTLALADLDLDGAIDILTVEQLRRSSPYVTEAVVRLNDRLRIALPKAQGNRVVEYDTRFNPATGYFTGTYTRRFNQVTREVDELGRQTIYQLDDTTGNVLRKIQVVGAKDSATQLTNRTGDDLVTDYTYTADGRVLDIHDPLNHVTHYDYTIDAKNVGGQLRRVTYAYGTVDAATVAYEYDAAGNETASIDEYGNRTTYTYKAGTNLLEKMTAPDPDGIGPLLAPETSYLYDENGNQTTITGPDPDGTGPRTSAVITNQYDEMNRLIQTIAPDPDGVGPLQAAITTYEYDLNGNQTAMVDALGRRTESSYDSRNRLVATVRKDAQGNLLSQSGSLYDATNNATGAIDANGKRTNTVYDKRGRRIREIDALGNITRFIYDAANQLVAQVDATGNMTRYVYDDLGRQIEVIDANGNRTQTVYDKNGNVIAQIDANGNRSESRYDNRDRRVRSYDANNTAVPEANRKFTETKYGRVTIAGQDYAQLQVIDPNLNATTYVYDGLGRLSTDTNQLGKTRTYNYDAVGNQIEMSDRNGLTRTFEYDNLNRQTKENWLDNGVVTRSFLSQYDVLDRLVDVTDQSVSGGTVTNLSEYGYSYDDLDRVQTIDNFGIGGVARVLLTYGYDAEGNLKSVTETINGTLAGTTAYDYDALDRATQITQSGTGIANKRVKLSYNAVGQMETLQRLSGTTFNQTVATTTYAYNDPLNRLTQIQHTNTTGGTLTSYAFDYDNGSRIRKIMNADGTFVEYDYANNDELTTADYSPTNRTDENYTYDANGNRTNTGYVTGTNNQLSSDGKYAYTYDDEGNLKTRYDAATNITRTFNWDYRNRLTSVVESGVTLAAYTYDANNHRISKTTGEGTTRYVYDKNNVALEFMENDMVPTMRYLYGPKVDQILAQESSGTTTWHLADQLGSVRELINSSGTIVNQYTYDSFGKLIGSPTGTVDTRYRYTGREWDGETGLYFYRARYYDANVGRFIGQDPLGFRSGDRNFYRYAKNSPANFTDSSGLIPEAIKKLIPKLSFPFNKATYPLWRHHLAAIPTKTPEFLDYYFSDNRKATDKVDLEAWGLLATFKGTPEVSRATASYYNNVVSKVNLAAIQMKAVGMTEATIRDHDSLPVDVTAQIFSVGHSILHASYEVQITSLKKCEFKYEGKVSYSLRDSFSDVPDLFNGTRENEELFGGTSYDIVADWSDRVSGKLTVV